MNHGQLLHNIVLFTRALRRLGLTVGAQETRTLLAALEHLDLDDRRAVRDAARTVLVHRREHLVLFDRVFDLFWRADVAQPQPKIEMGRQLERRQDRSPVTLADGPETGKRPALEVDEPWLEIRRTWSETELLRHKDFADLTPEELATVRQLLREQVLTLPPRRTRRTRPGPRSGRFDLRRSLRSFLRHGGEPIGLVFRERQLRHRPLVVLADVSGSMEPYARIFLEFLYTLRSATDRLEAFVFGTRLTRITRQLAHRDVNQALRAAAGAIRDWGGGTRIGASLRRFNHDWNRRVLGHGAIVIVISDGWDRGDLAELEREIDRLRHSCDRLMWLNPLLGSPGYQPLSQGIRTVLPHVDDFLPVHNLESLAQLAAMLARLDRPGSARANVFRRGHHDARRSA